MTDPVLATARLHLRPLRPEDAAELHAHWTDPDVRRYLWDGEAIARETVDEVVAESGALVREHGFGLWAFRPREGGGLAGCGGYWHFRAPPELELVVSLAPRLWGRGLAAEAGRALMGYAFDALGFDAVQGSTDVQNAASARMMERLGMRLERRATLHGLDTVVYRVSPADWPPSGADVPG